LTWGAMGWTALTIAGATPMKYLYPEAILGVSVVVASNVGLLLVATRRVRDPRFAGEYRGSVRFPVDLEATVGDHPARIVDISLTGARVVVPGIDPASLVLSGDAMTLRITAANLELRTMVVRAGDSPDRGTIAALEFLRRGADHQRSVVQRLALLLFHAKSDPAAAEPVPQSDKRQVS